jgi:NitT/TauT family transport system substrate-binding protein
LIIQEQQMTQINRRALLLGAAGTLFAPAVMRAADAPTPIRFTLDWKLQGMHAPFFMARKKGYFSEQGLDVTIDQGEGSAATTSRVMSGAYDSGFGDINAIIEQASKKPGEAPLMVYQYYNRPPFIICVRESSGIKTLKDFEGRTIGAPAGSAAARLIPVLAKHNGLDATKVNMSNLQPSLLEQLLVKGQVDGISSYDNNVYMNLLQQGQDPDKDFRWFHFGDYGLNLYANGVMVSRKLAKENPKAVTGLVRAINRATRETAADLDSGIAVLMRIEPLLNERIERQRADYCFRKSYMTAETDLLGFGEVDDKRLTESIQIVAEAFGLANLPPASEIFDHGFLPPKSERTFKYTST